MLTWTGVFPTSNPTGLVLGGSAGPPSGAGRPSTKDSGSRTQGPLRVRVIVAGGGVVLLDDGGGVEGKVPKVVDPAADAIAVAAAAAPAAEGVVVFDRDAREGECGKRRCTGRRRSHCRRCRRCSAPPRAMLWSTVVPVTVSRRRVEPLASRRPAVAAVAAGPTWPADGVIVIDRPQSVTVTSTGRGVGGVRAKTKIPPPTP